MSSFKNMGRLWYLLKRKWKIRSVSLIFLMLISGFSEVITLGSIVPFLAVIVDSTSVLNYPYVGDYLQYLGITEEKDLFIFFSLIFIAAIFLSAILRLFITRLNLYWCYELISDFSINAFERTIYQPFLYHSSRNSSELVGAITVKISTLQTGIILPVISSIQVLILILSIITALFFILPISNIIALGFFSLLYALIAFLFKKSYSQNSEIIATQQVKIIKVLQESLAGIRDIILGNYYDEYIKQYSLARRPLDKTAGKNAYMIIAPKFIIESLGMALIVFLILYNYSISGDTSIFLPSMGALALGAQRILPYLQQLYAAYSTILSSRQSVEDSLDILEQSMEAKYLIQENDGRNELIFNKSIELHDVSFKYSTENNFSLNNLNLRIKKGSLVGIIGSTGSGKSTLMDLLMGLIPSTTGVMKIDGKAIGLPDLLSWQRKICTVPQNIILADTSIKNNISLGQVDGSISTNKLQEAAQKSQLLEYVKSLPEGLDTEVGERGSRISGGQRQRIGIARALYKGGEVLFLDEATNALDMKTEDKILNDIKNLENNLTIIIVAHNINTVKDCDKIVVMDKGSIVEDGTFDEISNSENFKKVSGELL